MRSSTDVSHFTEVDLLCEAPQTVDVEQQFYNVGLQADFIPGLENTLADAISRVCWFLRDERELMMKYIKQL